MAIEVLPRSMATDVRDITLPRVDSRSLSLRVIRGLTDQSTPKEPTETASPFKDNGKDGRFVTLDGQIHYADAVDGRWEIKNGASYPAMIGMYLVEVLREKDYYVDYAGTKRPKGSVKPTFRLYDSAGIKPELGREVPLNESPLKIAETEVAIEDTNLLRRITVSPPEK